MAVLPEWADIDGEVFGKEFFEELQKSLLSSALLSTSTLTFAHREPQKVYKMELIGPQLPAACPYCEEGRNFILQKTRVPRVRKNNRRKNNPDAYNFSIRCGCCGCEGPWSKTPGNAWRLWNMRPTEKKLAEKLEELEQKYVSSRRVVTGIYLEGERYERLR